jgi:hypothetical protein
MGAHAAWVRLERSGRDEEQGATGEYKQGDKPRTNRMPRGREMEKPALTNVVQLV